METKICKEELKSRLEKLAIQNGRASYITHRCDGSNSVAEEGTRVLMKKIRGPYIFGCPIFEPKVRQEKLLAVLQKLNLASNYDEARKITEFLTNNWIFYSHDRYGDFLFQLELQSDKKGPYYLASLKGESNTHKGCDRIYMDEL